MCTAGTCGFAIWATRLIPVAKKLGSSAAPWMVAANSGEKRPPTVETLTPTFSNTLPFIRPRTPPPPGEPSGSVRSHGIYSKAASLPASRSISSNAAQMRVAKRLEPVARGLLLIVQIGFKTANLPVWRSASPSAMRDCAGEVQASGLRRGSGAHTEASQASCTFSGTPALSCPNSRMSSPPKREVVRRDGRLGREQDEPAAPIGLTKRVQLCVPDDFDVIDIIHCGAPDAAIVPGEIRIGSIRSTAAPRQAAEAQDRADIAGTFRLVEGDPHAPRLSEEGG